ncbi:unnamed protein product [Calypogeia fissa]
MASSAKAHTTHRNSFDEVGCEVVGRIFSNLPPFSLAYCSAVCSSFHDVITSAPNLWKSAYFLDHRRLNSGRFPKPSSSIPLEKVEKGEDENKEREEEQEKTDDFRTWFIEEEQKTRLASGPASAFQWRAHHGRVNCCRMVMGEVLSGSSDGTVKEWSAGKTGQLQCGAIYKVPEKAPVVHVEFDGNKVMGAAGKDVFVWSRTGNSRKLLKRMGGQMDISSLCVADSDLAMGCLDGTVRVYDLYSSRCT